MTHNFLIRTIAFRRSLVNACVIGFDALGALGIVGHGRLRINIVDARDGINEVVVSSKRVPDQSLREDAGVTSYRSARCKAGPSNKSSAMGPEPPSGWRSQLFVTALPAWRNDVSPKRTDMGPRREHVSLVVVFRHLPESRSRQNDGTPGRGKNLAK